MADIYLARDPLLDRKVVVKALPSDHSNQVGAKERFEREARVLSELNHPAICAIYDRGENFLVLEYVDGLPVQGPLEPSVALPLAIKITEALEAIHAKNIIHRDLKPANILVTKSDEIKLIDFGLSLVRDQPDEDLTQSTVDSITPLFTVSRYLSGDASHKGASGSSRRVGTGTFAEDD
jgi:eukaryotic-like serine/threonine-protein kinase